MTEPRQHSLAPCYPRRIEDPKCKSCKYYLKATYSDNCMRYPPPYPEVKANLWCGEYQYSWTNKITHSTDISLDNDSIDRFVKDSRNDGLSNDDCDYA